MRYRKNIRGRKRKNNFKKYVSTVIQRGLYPIADRTITKFKFVDYYHMTGNQNLGIPLYYIYRGSNAYDPVFAAGGGSCTGYSDLSSRYLQATVLSSSIKVLATDSGTDAANIFAVSIVPSRGSWRRGKTFHNFTHCESCGGLS